MLNTYMDEIIDSIINQNYLTFCFQKWIFNDNKIDFKNDDFLSLNELISGFWRTARQTDVTAKNY